MLNKITSGTTEDYLMGALCGLVGLGAADAYKMGTISPDVLKRTMAREPMGLAAGAAGGAAGFAYFSGYPKYQRYMVSAICGFAINYLVKKF